MTEFGGNELRKARENAGIRQWQIASEIGVCEALIGRWERGEAFPSPDDVDRLEIAYKAQGLWHKWMLSNCDSYRRHYRGVDETTTAGSVLRGRFAIEDVMCLQSAIERDVSEDGRIDNPINRDKYEEVLRKAIACLTDTLARIEKRGGAK
jgi:transcriptional regulator with XRE-family HTH domain